MPMFTSKAVRNCRYVSRAAAFAMVALASDARPSSLANAHSRPRRAIPGRKPMPTLSTVSATARPFRAALGALAVLSVSASAAFAGFGPITIVGNHYHQSSDVTSPTGTAAGACTATTKCYFLFQVAPSSLKIFVDRVSCKVTSGAIPVDLHVRVRRGSTLLPRYWNLLPIGFSGNVIIVNASVALPLKAGESAVVYFENLQTVNFTGRCDLYGQVVP